MNEESQNIVLEYLIVVLKHWKKIALGTFVCAFVAAVYALNTPKTYEASTTVLVYPPFFKDTARTKLSASAEGGSSLNLAELMPLNLPLDTYKALAESKGIFRKLVAELSLEDTPVAALQERCAVTLTPLTAGRPQGVILSQSIVFRARDSQPQRAMKIVETWVRLFKESVDALTLGQLDETYELVESMWASTKDDLERAEEALERFRGETNLELLNAQLTSSQEKLTELESALVQAEIDISAERAKLESIGIELAKEDRKESLFKAPPDEAIWLSEDGALTATATDDVTPLAGFLTEELNPNYTCIREMEFTSAAELSRLEGQKSSTTAKIADLNVSIEELTRAVAEGTTTERRLSRELETYEATYLLVASSFEKGKIAKLNRSSDIRIADDMVVPDVPSGPRRQYIVLLAAIVGAVLGAGFVVLSHAVRTAGLRAQENQ